MARSRLTTSPWSLGGKVSLTVRAQTQTAEKWVLQAGKAKRILKLNHQELGQVVREGFQEEEASQPRHKEQVAIGQGERVKLYAFVIYWGVNYSKLKTKTTNMHSLTVSEGQECGSSSARWLWLGKGFRLKATGAASPGSLTWWMVVRVFYSHMDFTITLLMT